MQQYDIKRGLQENLEKEKLKATAQNVFGKADEKDGKLVISFGALKELKVWSEGKKLCVDTTMDTSVGNDIAAQTIKAYNTFLERVTGLTSKERGKKAQKAAKEGKL
ncbi:MAG: hypothetical protein A3K60_03095 [Euryarchaeota archaeon RBG_19FT_COMBO_56_21]|nr:MAG: hypothetical protein A3K60_03095 [Euryarchaeota archaeon RBG_19FT_COMBO_56_21]